MTTVALALCGVLLSSRALAVQLPLSDFPIIGGWQLWHREDISFWILLSSDLMVQILKKGTANGTWLHNAPYY